MPLSEAANEALHLKECEQRARLVRMATDDSIWDWDIKTNLVDRSPRMAKFGHTDWQTDCSRAWWERHIHPDDREATIFAIEDAIKGNAKSVFVEYRFCKADGNIAYIYDRAFIIRDAAGVAIRAVGAMIDLTELRLVRLLLRKAENRLAYTSRLIGMGTMGAMLAHELNQPLAAAANFIRASRHIFASAETANFEQLHEALEGAERSTLRAGDIIRKLRQLVTDRGILGENYVLAQIIQDGCAIGLSEAKPREIFPEISVSPVELTVWVESTQVGQVIANLVRNSVESTERIAAPKIVIDAIEVGDFAQISIRDNGSGIADDIRDGIFSAIVTTKAAGMGIGLSICRTIIEAQGGEIWLESSEPGATDFRFTLPLRGPQEEKELSFEDD